MAKNVRKRTVNIHNSDRSVNANYTTVEKEAEGIKVTALNAEELYRTLGELKDESTIITERDENKYLVYQQRYGDDTLNNLVFDHGGFIQYYVTGKASVHVINKLAGVPESEIIYGPKKEYTADEVENVRLASMATSTVVDAPIVLPDINVYDYLFSLHSLRYHVDKVRISFPALEAEEITEERSKYYEERDGKFYVLPEYKYKCFCHLQEPLSTWKMNIWIVCDDAFDANEVECLVDTKNRKFKYNHNVTILDGVK
ncbi:hypothetical protein NIGALANA_152 [Bacillus phage Nigalana]|uniref:Uncharacterized protein n=2 Tax=Wphvirus megatron TaxID=1987728 RepID=A0A1B1PB03_9CAUD|nr:hypothetical protein QLX47_gp151 [Bacillus phage Eyuki]YP_009282544.1 hypothetical protein BI005_gp152 [Bacillus phage Nigalana]YP_009285095.1 hypothetical protein BIZ88_gp153 [Bacillus phage DirtyBetty]YP_009287028.1 hypothetical protein BI006_gp152 [Bacillus phage Nemo]ASR78610.1 hypothetical protein BUBS_153 [Bacillus phage Bubs]ASR79384.1 hypothetical protein ZAINNY_153 [Bacillus phage Zainny]AUV57786.1 hypothetical protein HONESTABE_149 [Bacillus phage HonestAbe]ALA46609.1 hypothetic